MKKKHNCSEKSANYNRNSSNNIFLIVCYKFVILLAVYPSHSYEFLQSFNTQPIIMTIPAVIHAKLTCKHFTDQSTVNYIITRLSTVKFWPIPTLKYCLSCPIQADMEYLRAPPPFVFITLTVFVLQASTEYMYRIAHGPSCVCLNYIIGLSCNSKPVQNTCIS